MLGPADYLLLFADLLIEAVAVVLLIKSKALSKYFTFVFYLCASIATGIGRYAVLAAAGPSNAYIYFYYFSDVLLTICLYLVLMNLYSLIFAEMKAGKLVRVTAMVLLIATAAVSYHTMASSSHKLLTSFSIELSQNLYFVGVVLSYLLWATMVKLRENRTRLMQLALSMGVYFSAFAGSFALGNMYPKSTVWHYVCHLMVVWLPISWAYTFMKVSEEARTATARVIAPTAQ